MSKKNDLIEILNKRKGSYSYFYYIFAQIRFFLMESNDKFYFSIGEVSEILNLPISQLRFWSGEFDLNVRKNRKGDRLYQQEDIEKLKKIKQLLKEEGFTIEGAKKKIKDKNIDQKIITSNLDHNEIIETLLSIKSGLEDLKNSI